MGADWKRSARIRQEHMARATAHCVARRARRPFMLYVATQQPSQQSPSGSAYPQVTHDNRIG